MTHSIIVTNSPALDIRAGFELFPATLARPETAPSAPIKKRQGGRKPFFPLEEFRDHFRCCPNFFFDFQVGRRALFLQTKSVEAVQAVIDLGLNARTSLMMRTEEGYNFCVPLKNGAYARSDIGEVERQSSQIGVKAAGSKLQLVVDADVLAQLAHWKSFRDVPAVGQDVVDAIFAHNGVRAPRPTVLTANLGLLSTLLGVKVADMSFEEWERWLKAAFHLAKGSEEGLAMFDGWSKEFEDYSGFDALAYQWSLIAEEAAEHGFDTLHKLAQDLADDEAAEALYAA